MSYAIIRGKVKEVTTYATKEQAARAMNGVDVWLVDRRRVNGRVTERIVPAVRVTRPMGDYLVFRRPDGGEELRPCWSTVFPTFAIAKAHLVTEAKDELRSATRCFADAKADLRRARAHRKPKRGVK